MVFLRRGLGANPMYSTLLNLSESPAYVCMAYCCARDTQKMYCWEARHIWYKVVWHLYRTPFE